MPVERAPHDEAHPYTPVSNITIDSTLSNGALGLLVLLLSHPDDFEFDREYVKMIAGVGDKALRTLLRELQAAGFLEIRPRRAAGRIAGPEWTVREVPPD